MAVQSKTDDIVLTAMNRASLGAIGAEQAYVTASRGRERGMIFTDMTQDELLRAMRKKDIRISATELMRPMAGPGLRRDKLQPGLQEKARGFARRMRERYRGLRDWAFSGIRQTERSAFAKATADRHPRGGCSMAIPDRRWEEAFKPQEDSAAEANGAGEQDDGRPDFSKPYRAFGHPRTHALRSLFIYFNAAERRKYGKSKIQIQYEHLDSDDPTSEGFAEDGKSFSFVVCGARGMLRYHGARAAAGGGV